MVFGAILGRPTPQNRFESGYPCKFCGSGVVVAHRPSEPDDVPPVRKRGFDSRLPLRK